jgi:hypothetical protein
MGWQDMTLCSRVLGDMLRFASHGLYSHIHACLAHNICGSLVQFMFCDHIHAADGAAVMFF